MGNGENISFLNGNPYEGKQPIANILEIPLQGVTHLCRNVLSCNSLPWAAGTPGTVRIGRISHIVPRVMDALHWGSSMEVTRE